MIEARKSILPLGLVVLLLQVTLVHSFSVATVATSRPTCPEVSPATHLPNQFYTWKEDLKIRYQSTGPLDGPPVLLVHGLFVNSDHWRKTLPALAQAGYRAYALDLLGCGYSDKAVAGDVARRVNGEVWRFEGDHAASPSVLKDVSLGTRFGRARNKRIVDINLRHPLGSPYNFYTWCDILTDFSRDIILPESTCREKAVTLVANSIGTISCLQATIENPDLFRGVFSIAPNFRELHVSEVPAWSVPVIRAIQKMLRQYGQGAYDALTKPDTIRQILKEPYARTDAIDDTLVKVLLDPLLTPGSSKVVFDALSYSAGPLPEQQLIQMKKPVWICYGNDDPWTPGPRVEAMADLPTVERVQGWDGVGHCPHDEAPELVNPMLLEFLEQLDKER